MYEQYAEAHDVDGRMDDLRIDLSISFFFFFQPKRSSGVPHGAESVEELAAVSLKNPVKLFINENTDTSLNLRQEFVRIRENHENDRESIVAGLVTRNFPDHTIVFVQTKKACQRLHIVLGLLGVKWLYSGDNQEFS
ncbi:unnamed protein product [Gongylonema pulchrum]|uniref:Helicase C-terminal domain-containing protein n=1 Tax=Gongylonema pulchrum TaxID=637853 RepID=A0A183DGK7_9BILA|nr:unnamed protein product [Gongylonema pulchrum]